MPATVTVSASPIDSLRVAALQTLKNKKRTSFRPETPTTSDEATISLLYDDEPPVQSSVPPKPRTQNPSRASKRLDADRPVGGELEDGEISDAGGSAPGILPDPPALVSLNKPTPTNVESDSQKYPVSFRLPDRPLIINGYPRFQDASFTEPGSKMGQAEASQSLVCLYFCRVFIAPTELSPTVQCGS